MEFVVDANALISALISPGGKTCELVFSDELRLFAPEYLLGEIEKHKNEIIEKSGLEENDFEQLLFILSLRITFVPFAEFGRFVRKAGSVCPDENDVEYFALALRLGCPVWSNDARLKKQEMVSIKNTAELLELLKEKV